MADPEVVKQNATLIFGTEVTVCTIATPHAFFEAYAQRQTSSDINDGAEWRLYITPTGGVRTLVAKAPVANNQKATRLNFSALDLPKGNLYELVAYSTNPTPGNKKVTGVLVGYDYSAPNAQATVNGTQTLPANQAEVVLCTLNAEYQAVDFSLDLSNLNGPATFIVYVTPSAGVRVPIWIQDFTGPVGKMYAGRIEDVSAPKYELVGISRTGRTQGPIKGDFVGSTPVVGAVPPPPVLAGDANGPAAANHVDHISGPGAGVAVDVETPLTFPSGGLTLPTTGALRFPSAPAGLGNSYEALNSYTAVGQVIGGAPRTLFVIRFFENPANDASVVFGDPGFYFNVVCGGENGATAISTSLQPNGGVKDCYIGVRSDGLGFANFPKIGALGGFFERSDVLAGDYAIRDEYTYNGTTLIRFGPSVTQAQGRYFDAGVDRPIWDCIAGTQNFGDAGTGDTNLKGQRVTAGSALYGMFADSGLGYASLRANSAPIIQAVYPDNNKRVAALANAGIAGLGVVGANPGDLTVHIGLANTVPGANPVAGFLLYVDPADNILKARGPGGTITPLANP